MKRPNWREETQRAVAVANYPYTANDAQVGGDHYLTLPMQTWDFIVQNGLGFLDGNVVKYIARYRKKGGMTDLRKAQHYLQKLIEVEEAKTA